MSETINNPIGTVAQPCQSPVATKMQQSDNLALMLLEQEKTPQMEDINPYWSKFSNSKKSLPTYLTNLCTHSKRSCLAKKLRKQSFPEETIERRLSRMRPVGNLTQQDMYYLLSVTLNLNNLNPLKRRDFMELLQQRSLLNTEILNYLQIIVRRPSAGLNQQDIESFLILCEEIKANTSAHHTTANPHALITQSDADFDSKQLVYLKNILKTKRNLNQNQLLYLINLLEGLHDTPETQRNQFFQILHKNQVLTVHNMQTLSEFLQQHSRPFDSKKLRILLYELEDLMGIEAQSPRIIKESLSKASKHLMQLDLADVRKSLDYLMKGGIPNIVRLNNFKQFLKNLLNLNSEQLEQNLKQLKNSNALSLEDFKFIQNFVLNENVEGDVEKKKLLCQLLKQVGSTTLLKTPSAVFSIAPAKGPIACPTKEEELQRNLQALTPCALYEARLYLEMDKKSKDNGLDFKNKIEATNTQKTLTMLAPTSSKELENVVPSTRKVATTSDVDKAKPAEKTAAVDVKSGKEKTDALEEKAEVKSKKNVMDKTKPEKGKQTEGKVKESKNAELSNTKKQTNEFEKKKVKTKDKFKSKKPLVVSTDSEDEIPGKKMESADINKGAKTTSKEGKTKGLPAETIFTKIEDTTAIRKAKVPKRKEINFEVVTSDLSVIGHDEEDLQDVLALNTPNKSLESLSKSKPTTEIKSSSDLIGKKKMPNVMDSQQPKHAGVGVSFFKSTSFFGKTNKIVSIRNGKLILR